MMPSNARLLTCPACGGKKKILSLASGNTFDGEVWSDLKKIYPMLPEPSFVQKCPECGNYYLLSRQKTVEYDKEFSFEKGELSYSELKAAYEQFKSSIDLDTKEELEILMMIVHAHNDLYYRDFGVRNESKESREEFRKYVMLLIEMLTESNQQLYKAELYREICEFGNSLKTLEGIADESIGSVYRDIKFLAEKSIPNIFRLGDEELSHRVEGAQTDGLDALSKSNSALSSEEKEYMNVASIFISSRDKKNFVELRPYLSEHIKFVVYGRNEYHGIEEFENYWIDWAERYKNLPNATSSVRVCKYTGKPAVHEECRGYRDMYFLFTMKDGLMTYAAFLPNPLHDSIIRYIDLDREPFKYEDINRSEEFKIDPKPLRTPCLQCGRSSENLEWFRANIDTGPLEYLGDASICPDCKTVVEFYPEVMFRK
jgi:hypothetical protein